MDYSLIEQKAGYAAYLNAGDTLAIDQDNDVKQAMLETAVERAAWFDSVFSEANLEPSGEVSIELLRTLKGSEQSYPMLFRSEFPKDTNEEPFRLIGFEVASDNSMGIATSGMSGAIGYFPLHEQRGVWEYLTDENLDRDAVFALCEMGLKWATET